MTRRCHTKPFEHLWSSLIITATILLLLNSCDLSNTTAGEGSISEANQEPDPVAIDIPIAYIERTLPQDVFNNSLELRNVVIPDNVLDPAAFHPGARLIIKARSKADAPEIDITKDAFPNPIIDPNNDISDLVPTLYDVKDLDVSADGSQLVFAMRAPQQPNVRDEDQPKWNLWRYDRINEILERIIQSDTIAELAHDVAPHFLPDGKVVFSSNRQRRTRAILLDEGKSQYAGQTEDRQMDAFMLHVIDPSLQEIEQITFNASHDLQPTVLPNGKILFLRWDNAARLNRLSLYSVNSDGSELSLVYGYDSQNTGNDESEGIFFRTVPMPDGRILTILRPRNTVHYGGDIISIDINNFTENNIETPNSVSPNEQAQRSLSPGEVNIDGTRSPLGYFNSIYPFNDNTNRFLVSWSQCRLENIDEDQIAPCTRRYLDDENFTEAPADFGLWVLDLDGGTQQPVIIPRGDTMFTEAKLLNVRERPLPFEKPVLDEGLVNDNVGTLHIRNIYDIDGVDTSPRGIEAMADPAQTSATDRPVRFLRLFKHVPIPSREVRDFDNLAFGLGGPGQLRDILGYVPVEPDGSVKVKVPADLAFGFELIDAQGHAIANRTHNNWLSLRAGEERECRGCHTRASRIAHGRAAAEPDSIYPGNVGDINFTNTVLLDEFGTPHTTPIAGETMAQYYARVNGTREPSIDLVFRDEWTDDRDSSLSKAPDILASYANVAATRDPDCPESATTAPSVWQAPSTCRSVATADPRADRQWTALCRITINYLDSIQPLWERDRRSCDDTGTVLEDPTCINCHSRTDAMGNNLLPGGNLELTSNQSAQNMDYVTSYVDLINNDARQLLVDNMFIDVAFEDPNLMLEFGPNGEILNTPSGLFQRDPDTGELTLDDMGQPIPIYNPQIEQTSQTLRPAPARFNNSFFELFTVGFLEDSHTVNHKDFLSVDELKLIAEWLDVGAQYYNNPFDAPLNQ